MDPKRRQWNNQQLLLQQALDRLDNPAEALRIFLRHHAGVHSSRLSDEQVWSFEDEALEGLEPADFRVIPTGEDHSIAWVLWHMARIEDVTMNILASGGPQVFLAEGWQKKIGFDSVDTGNALDPQGIGHLSAVVDVGALQDYRLAVGKQTRRVVQQLSADILRQRVPPERLERVMQEGAVSGSTRWLLEYWGKKTIGGLLLMPPTRHNYVHLNEAVGIMKKVLNRKRKWSMTRDSMEKSHSHGDPQRR
jgi:hypothetical protein